MQGILDFQIGIEERISRIYGSIAHQFSSELERDTEWVAFWKLLATDEACHAALLSVEKEFLQTGVRVEKPVEVDPPTRAELDLLLAGCEEKIGSGVTEAESIEILLTLETSEVNKIFLSLLNATDSKVLSYFASFSRAHQEHERRIQEGVRKYTGKEAKGASISSQTDRDQGRS